MRVGFKETLEIVSSDPGINNGADEIGSNNDSWGYDELDQFKMWEIVDVNPKPIDWSSFEALNIF